MLEFDCGDGTNGIGKLALGSYGTIEPIRFSPTGAADGIGLILGATGSVMIQGDVNYGKLEFYAPTASVGAVTIGGSLTGAVADAVNGMLHAGELEFYGPAGMVKIGGSVIGGDRANTGTVTFHYSFNSLTIGSDVVGGNGTDAGEIVQLSRDRRPAV